MRAYPTGEGTGDDGWLAQIELRYSMGNINPYVFFDQGSIRAMTRPLVGTTSNVRDLSGIGVGVRYQQGDWNLDATPRGWLTVDYRF